MKYKIKTLKNGLRVVIAPMKDNPTVTVLTLVGVGSDYENQKESGLSHFLEHMCFKGTTKRPTASDISHELDALGSQYNAFTSNELTGYYAKGDAKHFKKLLDVVSDIYLNSTFPEAEIEKEKGVICEEINMYEDMPARHVHDLFDRLIYGDTPAGRSIAGTHGSVRSMKRQDFVNYKNRTYTTSNTVLVLAGNIDEKLAFKEAEKCFKDLEHQALPKQEKSVLVKSGPKIIKKVKATDQVHLILGFHSFPRNNKKNTTLKVLTTVLGQGMSSRLFRKLREEMGVCYYVGASNNTRKDTGVFTMRAGVTTARTKEVVEVLLKECVLLTEEKVSEKELEKAKNYMLGNMKLSLEPSDERAGFYGEQLLFKDKVETLKEKEKEIRNVTSAQIQKLAKEIFIEENIRLALIAPESVQISEKILKLR